MFLQCCSGPTKFSKKPNRSGSKLQGQYGSSIKQSLTSEQNVAAPTLPTSHIVLHSSTIIHSYYVNSWSEVQVCCISVSDLDL